MDKVLYNASIGSVGRPQPLNVGLGGGGMRGGGLFLYFSAKKEKKGVIVTCKADPRIR